MDRVLPRAQMIVLFIPFRQVYFYEDGKPVIKEFGFTIINTMFKDALDYIQKLDLENMKLMKTITEEHDHSKSQFDSIVDSQKTDQGNPFGNSKVWVK